MGNGKLNVFPLPHFYDLYDDPKEEYPVTREWQLDFWYVGGLGRFW